jgi:hypothetical protein
MLALERCDRRADDADLVVQKPAKEIEVMRGEIEESAAACVSPSLPCRHPIGRRRLGVCGLDSTHFSDASGFQNRTRLLI